MAERDIVISISDSPVKFALALQRLWDDIRAKWPGSIRGQVLAPSPFLAECLFYKDKAHQNLWQTVQDDTPIGLIHTLFDAAESRLTFVIDDRDEEAKDIVYETLRKNGWEETL